MEKVICNSIGKHLACKGCNRAMAHDASESGACPAGDRSAVMVIARRGIRIIGLALQTREIKIDSSGDEIQSMRMYELRIIKDFEGNNKFSVFPTTAEATKKKRLNRTVQCAKCPWKVSTNPHEIPNNYDVEKHKKLKRTIADPTRNNAFDKQVRVMACHCSMPGKEEYCIGWLRHQLDDGNNIQMRMQMSQMENAGDIRVIGPQHERFEDTLPKSCDNG